MINRLEIKGFKSLLDVSVELGAVNIFIGANGSGKSNLLEAVGFLSAIISGSLESETIRYRGVRQGSPSSFRSSLKDKAFRAISITACDDQTSFSAEFGPDESHPPRWAIVNESAKFNGNEVLRRSQNGVEVLSGNRMSNIPVGNHSPSKSIALFWSLYFAYNKGQFQPDKTSPNMPIFGADFFEQLELFGIFTPSTPELRGFVSHIERDPLGLEGSRLGQAIDEMMKGAPDMLGPFEMDDVFELIDWADSLQNEPDFGIGPTSSIAGGTTHLRIGDRFMEDTHKSVSLVEASEGALYVLFLLALVGHEQSPKLFAVDNFDQALHPRLARTLTRIVSDQILADGSRQMLATTHNPLVLDGLNLLDDRIRLFTVERDRRGATQIHRVRVTEELMAQADEGLSLSRLWVMGRLGGIPKYL